MLRFESAGCAAIFAEFAFATSFITSTNPSFSSVESEPQPSGSAWRPFDPASRRTRPLLPDFYAYLASMDRVKLGASLASSHPCRLLPSSRSQLCSAIVSVRKRESSTIFFTPTLFRSPPVSDGVRPESAQESQYFHRGKDGTTTYWHRQYALFFKIIAQRVQGDGRQFQALNYQWRSLLPISISEPGSTARSSTLPRKTALMALAFHLN